MHLLPEKKAWFWLRMVYQRSEIGEFPSREGEHSDDLELTRGHPIWEGRILLEMALCSILLGC